MTEPSDTAVGEQSFEGVLEDDEQNEPTAAAEPLPNHYTISLSLSMGVAGEGVPFTSATASFNYTDGVLSYMTTQAYGPNGYMESEQVPTSFLRFANMVSQVGTGRQTRDVQDMAIPQMGGTLGQQLQQSMPRPTYGPSGGY